MEALIPLDTVDPELGFSEWVGTLVGRHRSALVRAALREGLVPEEALDVVQEAFATFLARTEWRALPRDTDDAEKLLLTLVKNHARNTRRKRSRKDEGMDALTGDAEVDHALKDLETLVAEAEAHIRLTGCLNTLKQVQRTIVTARFFDGSTGLEVASTLGLTPGNVAVMLHRAQKQLRSCLELSREALGLTK